MNKNESFYFSKEEPNKGCLLTLRDIILKQDENIFETKKYGMPCFCYKKKAFVYLWVDKKTTEPYILFVEGTQLSHAKLEVGKRSRMKILRVSAQEDIPINTVTLLLQTALDLYKKG